MYDYIITKPELCEETLAHYGIKGMEWRNKKGRTKESLRSNGRPKSRKRRITGKGSGAFKYGPGLKRREKFDRFGIHANEARTDEERRAMVNAAGNIVEKGSNIANQISDEYMTERIIKNFKTDIDQSKKKRK